MLFKWDNVSINGPFCAKNCINYSKFFFFLQTFNFTIITLVTQINTIQIAANTTRAKYKQTFIAELRR